MPVAPPPKPRVRVPVQTRPVPRISPEVMALSRRPRGRRAVDPFAPDHASLHPPGVLPSGEGGMAQDSVLVDQAGWAAGAVGTIFDEGLAFLGYAYLSALAQRPEFRRISEINATEMTRKWIKLQSTSDDDKADRIKELGDELDRLDVRGAFRKVAEYDGYMGRAHLYLDTGDTYKAEELKTSIGSGRDRATQVKFGGKRRFLQAVRPVEAVWCYPTSYNSNDPLRADWYEPDYWFVMGRQVHRTRLLKFVGREVPDMLKPAYSFGGLSMSQMAKPYVDIWLRTRQSVADLVHSFSVFVLKTNMSEQVMQGGEQLDERLELFINLRDNRGVLALDKDTEEFANVAAQLGGLHELQSQAQEHMSSVSGIPIVKLLGVQPAGLNASSEGEIRAFFDNIAAYQEKFFRPNLTRVIDMTMMSLWGEVDDEITFAFEELWSLDETALATKRTQEADTATKYIDAGVLWPADERARLAGDPSSNYNGIDAEDLPDLKAEEEQGLEPKGGAAKLAERGGGEEPGTEREGGEDLGDELGIAAMDAGTVGEDWSPAEVMAHPVTRAAVAAALQAASWKLTSTPDWFVDATLANLVDTFVDRLRLSRAQATALLAGVAAARRHAVHDAERVPEAAE